MSGPLFTNIASCIVLYVIFKVLFPAPVNPARNCILTNTLVFVNTRFAQPGLMQPLRSPALSQARIRMLPYALSLCQTVFGLYFMAVLMAVLRLFFPLLPASSFAFSSLSTFFFALPFSERSDIVPNYHRFCQHRFNKNFSDSTKPFSASHFIHYNIKTLISRKLIFLIFALIFLIILFTFLILRRINIT